MASVVRTSFFPDFRKPERTAGGWRPDKLAVRIERQLRDLRRREPGPRHTAIPIWIEPRIETLRSRLAP